MTVVRGHQDTRAGEQLTQSRMLGQIAMNGIRLLAADIVFGHKNLNICFSRELRNAGLSRLGLYVKRFCLVLSECCACEGQR